MRILIILSIAILMSAGAFAQQEPTSAKTRAANVNNQNGDAKELGAIPTSVLDITKLKGVVKSVDLQKRTVTVTSGKGEIELSFPQPAGREQIKTGKKLTKSLGRKTLTLEELTAGDKVELKYYTALTQLMELIVETQGRG